MSADPEVAGITVPMVLSAAAIVINAIALVAWFFAKLAAKTKDDLIKIGIDTANQQAAMALKQNADTAASTHAKFSEMTDQLHALRILDTQREGKQLALGAEVHRLDSRDDEQGRDIQNLRGRLDRGARTMSALMPLVDDPEDTQPPRRRLPSRGGGE